MYRSKEDGNIQGKKVAHFKEKSDIKLLVAK